MKAGASVPISSILRSAESTTPISTTVSADALSLQCALRS
jgi:hypothetical protein